MQDAGMEFDRDPTQTTKANIEPTQTDLVTTGQAEKTAPEVKSKPFAGAALQQLPDGTGPLFYNLTTKNFERYILDQPTSEAGANNQVIEEPPSKVSQEVVSEKLTLEELTPEEQSLKDSLVASVLQKTGTSRRSAQGDEGQQVGMEVLLSSLTLAEVKTVLENLDKKASQYHTEIAIKLVDPADPEAAKKINSLTQQLGILNFEVSDLEELQNWMIDMPSNDPEAAQEMAAQGCANIYAREVSLALGRSVSAQEATELEARFNKIYLEKGLGTALALIVSINNLRKANDRPSPEIIASLLGLDNVENQSQAVAEIPDESEAEASGVNSSSGVVTPVNKEDVKRDWKSKLAFGVAGWAKESMEASSVTDLVDAFFGDGRWGGSLSYRNRELWQSKESNQNAVDLKDLQRKMSSPQVLAKALLKVYIQGYGDETRTSLRNNNLNLQEMVSLPGKSEKKTLFAHLESIQESGDPEVLKMVLSEILKWLFTGTTDSAKKAQQIWNQVFPRVLYQQDNLTLGKECLEWFAQQYEYTPTNRWKDLAWPAVQEQAATAA